MTRRLVGEVTMRRPELEGALADLAKRVAASSADEYDVRLCQDGATAEVVLFEAGTENRIAKLNCGRITA